MGNMREISIEECNAVFGGTDGDEDEIVVVGSKRVKCLSDSGGFGMGFRFVYLSMHSFCGGGGGGSTGGNSTALEEVGIPNEEDDDCKAGAAIKVAAFIKSLSDADGDNDTDFEMSGYLSSNGDGTFGAKDNNLYTRHQTTNSGLPTMPWGYDDVYAIIHNHPFNSSDYNANFANRYPSNADWAALDMLAARHSNPSSLSMFILDPFGTLREFKYSDKALFLALTTSQMNNGSELPAASIDCTPET